MIVDHTGDERHATLFCVQRISFRTKALTNSTPTDHAEET